MNNQELLKIAHDLLPDSNIPSYLELVSALCTTLDGVKEHEIEEEFSSKEAE